MLIPILMIAFAPAQPPAMFADYVLQVPVRIENMNLSSASLSCDILHIGTAVTDRVPLGTPGTGCADVPLVGGVYNGTMTVTVTVSAANALRYPPTTWLCGLTYRWRNPDGTEFLESLNSAERATAYTRITGQEVTTNTTQITGQLPGG